MNTGVVVDRVGRLDSGRSTKWTRRVPSRPPSCHPAWVQGWARLHARIRSRDSGACPSPKPLRHAGDASPAKTVMNTIALNRRGTRTYGRAAHRRGRASRQSRLSTEYVSLRVVRNEPARSSSPTETFSFVCTRTYCDFVSVTTPDAPITDTDISKEFASSKIGTPACCNGLHLQICRGRSRRRHATRCTLVLLVALSTLVPARAQDQWGFSAGLTPSWETQTKNASIHCGRRREAPRTRPEP
jgi:hypothetical protein